MPGSLSISEWLSYLDQEYLSTFIKDGGTTIKFAVLDEELKPMLKQSIKSMGEGLGYQVVDIDSTDYRFHMPQDIFFAMASQVNWRLMTRKYILKLAGELNYRVNDIDAASNENIIGAIADANDLQSETMLLALRPEFQSRVYTNQSMSKDFRVAMTHLCLQEGNSGSQAYGGQPIIDWLTGNNPRVGSVRPFSIYNAINRTTAKVFIESALYWFHYVGFTGTVLVLDNSRVTISRRLKDGSRYYTRPMVMQHYQLLREFVDSAERLTATMMLTISTNEFLDVKADRRSRGIGIYPALQTRIMDDVRDRTLVNPIASLVRLD